jgi:hypothetical protein
MLNEIIKEEDMDTYTALTLKDKIIMCSAMAVFAVIWVTLMVVLPLSIVIGYFALLSATVAALWMSPRNVDVGIEDNGNFVKVK